MIDVRICLLICSSCPQVAFVESEKPHSMILWRKVEATKRHEKMSVRFTSNSAIWKSRENEEGCTVIYPSGICAKCLYIYIYISCGAASIRTVSVVLHTST